MTNYRRISLQASEENEDLVLVTNDVYCVMDGASGLSDMPLLPGNSDARWFVEKCADSIEKLSEDRAMTLTSIIRETVRSVEREFYKSIQVDVAETYQFPSSGIAMGRLLSGELNALLLGDCRLLINRMNGLHYNYVGSEKLEKLDALAIEEMSRYLRKYDYHESRARVLGTLRKHRAMMNTADGYWVLSFSDGVEHHGLRINHVLEAGDLVMMVTDGFYRLVDTFHVFSSEELVKICSKDGLSHVGSMLRELEFNDRDCRRVPRLKPSDDASALLICL